MNKSTRRKFIMSSATVGLGSLLAAPAFNNIFAAEIPGNVQGAGFDQTPLGYAYNALEPAIDAATMEIHYSKHAAAYSKGLKEAAVAEGIDSNMPLEKLMKQVSKYSTKVRNNGGGHYNHELFWKIMTPNAGTKPSDKLAAAINGSFGSMEQFKTKFAEAAKTRFGSGWAWLLLGSDNKLMISSTPNQDNPLMDLAEVKGTPLFGLDVWEHAYYLKYQNKRPEYIENFWKVLNWDAVSERFKAA